MAEVILFHHVLGLTDGVRAFADRLRARDHSVTVPDLYDGITFATIDEGVAHAEEVGFDELLETTDGLVRHLPESIVYAGFSLGALAAHRLAQTRPGARGAVLYHHGDVPVTTFGKSWPAGVDVQLHVNERDEFCDPAIVREFAEEAGRHAAAELFLYPGSSHLFTDSSLSDYERESAELAMERTIEFLGRL